MRVIFFGTPEFAASVLDYLFQMKISLVGIVTQPDRPKGRSLQMTSSPVKEIALAKAPNLPVFQPEKGSDPEFLASLKQLQPDLFVVVAFGQILPQQLLDIPVKGAINIHASLLPKYRGAAPIQRALMYGEKETGIAIQKMVKQLDAGDVIAVAKTQIPPDMTYGRLEKILCELAKPLLLFVLQSYEQGIPHAEPQNPTLATYAPKILVEEGEIKWNRPAEEIHHLVRALSPRPGAWCWLDSNGESRRIKILQTKLVEEQGVPGHFSSKEGVVGCGSNSLQIIELQPEGKKSMPVADWLRGFRALPQL